jgi:hypothetical protein
MARPRPWTVVDHEPLLRCEPNLWLADAAVPGTALRRRMSVVRCGDGRLVFHNAVPLREEDMRELERWGMPAFLVVPNRFHRLDLHAWKARYPALRVLAPAQAARAVAEVVPVDGELSALPRDPALTVHPIAGWKLGEAVLEVRSGDGASLLFGDAIMNNRPVPGPRGLVLRLLGSTGGPKVTPLARLLGVGDARAVARSFRQLAALPGLRRLVPSHGTIVDSGVADALRRVADALSPATP